MSWFAKYIKSSVGAKHIMAITGLMLVGFVLAHMLGNLQIFIGRDALNGYAESLKALGPILWIMRIGLIVAVVIHIWSAVRLTTMNAAARPVKYKVVHREKSTFASRVMIWSGIIVLAFLVFHLMQFTFGGGPFPDDFNQLQQMEGYDRHDVFNMVVSGFSRAPVTIAYVIAMFLLCLHLKHGIGSLFQTLGINHPKFNGLIKMAAPGIAVLVFIGNVSMPIACLAGWVKVVV
ncbi:MAG: succinate dehydrogenase cytochrome b subunit [Kofleriaceae bacterium]|nr:succinate dehydrogenase cytochrome b subunit [Kofleriaceae bacterium]